MSNIIVINFNTPGYWDAPVESNYFRNYLAAERPLTLESRHSEQTQMSRQRDKCWYVDKYKNTSKYRE